MKYSVSDWNGYKKLDFFVDGRTSFIVCPKEALPGNPWVWRTEFFGAFDYPDRALLERGWHLAYHCASDMYGCPEAIDMLRSFYDVAVNDFKMSPSPALFGFSRGGLYAVNFALKYPDLVGMLYLDAPVLDIRSWPGGQFSGPGEPECWEECKGWYKLTEETSKDFHGNPLDFTAEIAATKIPILLVCGAADKYVPYCENGQPFYKLVKESGGIIEQIVKPNCDHHPHSLSNPLPIVKYVENSLLLEKPGFFSDLKMNALGDSITLGTYTAHGDTYPASVAEKPWCAVAGEKLNFENVENYGINGTAISSTSAVNSKIAMSLRFKEMRDDADIVIVAGGTNDFGTNVMLGTADDKEDTSFCGALNVLCKGLKEKYPSADIVFITPIPRTDKTVNENGNTLLQYRDAITEIAGDIYGFHVIDGEIPELSEKASELLLDGAHPTPEGHAIYGNYIAEKLTDLLHKKLRGADADDNFYYDTEF